jgi:hypothetical protein
MLLSEVELVLGTLQGSADIDNLRFAVAKCRKVKLALKGAQGVLSRAHIEVEKSPRGEFNANEDEQGEKEPASDVATCQVTLQRRILLPIEDCVRLGVPITSLDQVKLGLKELILTPKFGEKVNRNAAEMAER